MADLLTSAQMRAIEQAAIASGEVTGLELMERAGRGVVEAVFAEWPELAETSHRAVVLCGPGNNGGDGFVVARLLKERGWVVEAYLYGDPEKLPPDAKVNYERWAALGATIRWPDWRFAERFGNSMSQDVIIDALFGTGLTRPMDEELEMSLGELDNHAPEDFGFHVAVDAPSGLCMDSGRILSIWPTLATHQCLTVTFHSLKLGHVLDEGPEWCGKVRVVDIGLGGYVPEAARLAGPDRYNLRKGEDQGPGAHKFDYGHALILSGTSGHTGAARLAARGALRIGAGLVTLGTPHDALTENAAQLTAIMLAEIDDAATLSRVLADIRINALVLGPGLGRDRARDLVPAALAAGRATVLDADALTVFADAPPALFALLHEKAVLTPHTGEFARLFPDIAEKLAAPATAGPAFSKVDATREAAARAGCVVLYKGHDTVIAAPDGRCAVNSAAHDRAAPWLATAGAGDVLAGMIAGLMARGYAPMKAAETAAWLHVEAARSFGPGLIAEDLPEELPGVFRSLGL